MKTLHQNHEHQCGPGCDHAVSQMYDGPARSPFVHLHNHTHHSVVDGLQTLPEMVSSAIADNQPGIAITDHGTLSGALKLVEECRRQGSSTNTEIKPILGIEAYLAIGDRREKNTLEVAVDDTGADPDTEAKKGSGTKQRAYEHLTILAENATGWRNLMKMSSASYSDGMFYKPRIDMGLLAEHSRGLIILTGCIGGPVAGRLARGDVSGARNWLDQVVERVGQDNVFVEVMDHGIDAQLRVIPGLVDLAREFGLRTVATNDAHYTLDSDSQSHDLWLAVQQRLTKDDPERWRFPGHGHHLRTSAEMRHLFDNQSGTEFACDNTLLIAERIASIDEIFPSNEVRLPAFPLPSGFSSSIEYLRHMVWTGAEKMYGSPIPGDVQRRLSYEFEVITSKGFADYFLIVADMINWARSNGIRVGAGRGSAAGCAVSYCIGIVTIDPIEHGLLFERFLHPDRNAMPDIDTDFEDGRRSEVLEYLRRRYGNDHVAHIGTFGTVKAKGAIRDAARVLNVSIREPKLTNALSDAVPKPHAGKTVSLAEALDPNNPAGVGLRSLLKIKSSRASDVINLAAKFEDRIRSESVHPCAMVITEEPLTDLVPLRTIDGAFVTQFEDEDIERLGLLKLDILGLRNLSIIERTLKSIETSTGITLDLNEVAPIDADDEAALKTWKMLQSGDTSSVFQLESSGIQELCRRLKPSCFDDIAALIALYRPGPMASNLHLTYADRKNGREPISYKNLSNTPVEVEVLDRILGETQGVLIYQESAMQLARELAGFTPGEADDLRKAIGKKIDSMMNSLEEKFVRGVAAETEVGGVIKPAYSAETGKRVWDWIKAGADYVFNKSHSFAYAHTTWLTAWLKANYPVHFAAANFAEQKDSDRRKAIFADLRKSGIPIIGPNINESRENAAPSPDGKSVQLGLSDISGMSDIAAYIVEERDAVGPYTSPSQLAQRVTTVRKDGKIERSGINVGTMDKLIKSGALDSIGPSRFGMAQVAALSAAGITAPMTDVEWHPIEKLHHEQSVLGLYVSDHPIRVADNEIEAWKGTIPERSFKRSWISIEEVQKQKNLKDVYIVGVVSQHMQSVSKSGNRWTRFNLEDGTSYITVLGFRAFIDKCEKAEIDIANGMVVAVRGRISFEGSSNDYTVEVINGEDPPDRGEARMIAERLLVIETGDKDVDEELSAAPIKCRRSKLVHKEKHPAPADLPATDNGSGDSSLLPEVATDYRLSDSAGDSEEGITLFEFSPDADIDDFLILVESSDLSYRHRRAARLLINQLLKQDLSSTCYMLDESLQLGVIINVDGPSYEKALQAVRPKAIKQTRIFSTIPST